MAWRRLSTTSRRPPPATHTAAVSQEATAPATRTRVGESPAVGGRNRSAIATVSTLSGGDQRPWELHAQHAGGHGECLGGLHVQSEQRLA